jgi:hypothetical protein
VPQANRRIAAVRAVSEAIVDAFGTSAAGKVKTASPGRARARGGPPPRSA